MAQETKLCSGAEDMGGGIKGGMMRETGRDFLRNRRVRILLAAEGLCLLAVLLSFFRPLPTVSPQLGQRFHLDAGTYTVRIAYTAGRGEDGFVLWDEKFDSQTVLFGTAVLSKGKNTEDCELWVLRDTDSAVAVFINSGDEGFQLHEFSVEGNRADSRILLFLLLTAAGAVNLLVFVRMYDRKYGIALTTKCVWGALFITWLFSCLPCFVDYNLWGDDWGFHLLRVEGLISGLQDGQFPVRIQGNWLRGYGYAVSVFYSDLFLVIPMIFRLIGFPVSLSWNMFLIVINGATLLIAYHCLKRCFRSAPIGAVATILYTLSAYRLYNLYSRAAMGEVMAMAFLPVVFYGFYLIFTADGETAEYDRGWWITAVGLTGVIQTHVLTCEMLAFCIAALCLVMIKRVLRRGVFLALCKAAAMTLLLNLWYLLPFADYLLTGKFNVGHAETMTIKSVRDWAIWPSHPLFLFYGGGTRGNVRVGMNWTGTYSIGAALLAAGLIWLYLEFVGDMKRSRFAGRGLGRLMFGYTVFFLVIATYYIPWDRLQNMGGIVETLVLSLQFPYRFLALACLTAAVLAGVLLVYMKGAGSGLCRGVGALLVGIAFFFSAYQLNQLMVSHGFAQVYNKKSMGSTYLSNAEYLPYGADIGQMQPDRLLTDENTKIESYEKGQYTLRTKIGLTNSGKDGYVELPLLYYRGYAAQVTETGQRLAVTEGSNSAVRIEIPPGLTGTVQIWFSEPWHWRAAELVSLAALLYMAVRLTAGRRNAPRKGQRAQRGGRLWEA